jgi:hypothetical protein
MHGGFHSREMFLAIRRRPHLRTLSRFLGFHIRRFPVKSASAIVLHAPSQHTFASFTPSRQMTVWRAPGIQAPGLDDPPEYVPLEETEDPSKYRPRGYHPIDIGDVLADRYTIVHKLGYGGWSTIWLARDATTQRYVAIKIGLADSGSHEVDILRELSGSNHPTGTTIHPGQSAIPDVLDSFAIHGPNGTHSTLDTRPVMVSVAMAKEGSDLRVFQLPVARAIAAQLAQAVAYVHSQGFVHGGKSSEAHPPHIPRPQLMAVPRSSHGKYPPSSGHQSRFTVPRATIRTIPKAGPTAGPVC